MDVWRRRLVDRPVVVWRVLNWVLKSYKRGLGGSLLVEHDFIRADKHLFSEGGSGHFVLHENWVDKNWNSLGERLLLVKNNFIVTDSHIKVKGGIMHLVVHKSRVHDHWYTLSEDCLSGVLLVLWVLSSSLLSMVFVSAFWALSGSLLGSILLIWLLSKAIKRLGDRSRSICNEVFEVSLGDVVIVQNVINVLIILGCLLHLHKALCN